MTDCITSNFTRLLSILTKSDASELSRNLIEENEFQESVPSPTQPHCTNSTDSHEHLQNGYLRLITKQSSPTFHVPPYLASCSNCSTNDEQVPSLESWNYISDKKVADLKLKSVSGRTFACLLVDAIFDRSELIAGNISGRGKTKDIKKEKLDPNRIKFIENLCTLHYNQDNSKDDFIFTVRAAITRHVNELSKINKL